MSQYVSLPLTQIYTETTFSLDPLYLERMALRPLRHAVKGGIDNCMVVAAFITGLAEVWQRRIDERAWKRFDEGVVGRCEGCRTSENRLDTKGHSILGQWRLSRKRREVRKCKLRG